MEGRFPRRAAAVALIAAAAASLLAWLFDEQVGFPEPFDRVVRDTGVIPAFAICLLITLAASKEGRAWLVRRVPVVSAEALGLFRIAFAACLWIVVTRTVGAPFRTACLVLLALFAGGVAARVSFALFVLVFTRVHLGETDSHALALPLKTLWLMMIVPWGAGLSVDALARRVFSWRPSPARSRAYGLAAWIPVMMLGLAYAAAAFAKIDEVGPRWITGGAVKYFFLLDGHDAPVQWGRYVARSDALSVLFSGLAVAGESAVILAAIWSTPAIVCAAGLVALSLHLGFYVFQGVWWTAWWVLLPAFLPWEPIASTLRLSRPVREPLAAPGIGRLSWGVGLVLLLAVLQQPVASLMRVTYGFALSDFPMYSNVYFSTREEMATVQEEHFQPPPLVRLEIPAGPGQGVTTKAIEPGAALSDVARKLTRGEPLTDADQALMRDVVTKNVTGLGATPPRVDVLADTWKFDWSIADFVPRQQWKALATVNLAEGVVEVRKP